MKSSLPALLKSWLIENRTSARIAFLLRTICMGANAVLSLVWTPLFLRALGTENYGTYAAFLAVLGVGVASEFGLGAATGIRTNRLIAAGDDAGLRCLHRVSRTVFAVMAIAGGAVMSLLAIWLPDLLRFDPTAARGSLQLLFALGGVNIAIAIFTSYLDNTSYAAGTVVWPIVPAFALTQVAFAIQIGLASLEAALWIVHAGGLLVVLAQFSLAFVYYRCSHPVFSSHLGFALEWRTARDLLLEGLWAYPFGVSLLLNSAADRLVVNAYFGAGRVPHFQLNNRLCELASTVALTAGAVSMPKIIGRLISRDLNERAHGRRDVSYLSRFQALVGLVGACGYLLINDLFISTIFGPQFQVEIWLQAAFATTLILAVNTDVYLQLCGRVEQRGLRVGAITVLGCAVLNLALSAASARQWSWFAGVGWATCLSQIVSLCIVAEYVRRRDSLGSPWSLLGRTVFVPLVAVGTAVSAKILIGSSDTGDFLALLSVYCALTVAYMHTVGPSFREVRREVAVIAGQVGRRTSPR